MSPALHALVVMVALFGALAIWTTILVKIADSGIRKENRQGGGQ